MTGLSELRPKAVGSGCGDGYAQHGESRADCLRNDLLQSCNKRRKILADNLPKNILVQIHVVVYDLMTHADNFPPRDFGVGCLSFGCYVPCGFSKYLNKVSEGSAQILIPVVGVAAEAAHFVGCLLGCFQHMGKIELVILGHTGLPFRPALGRECEDAGISA